MILLALFSGTAVFFIRPHRTKAFLGFGDIVAINLDDLFKSIAFTIADTVNQHITRQFMNGILSSLKIQNYDIYTRNLANQVYMTTALKGKSTTKQYVTRVLAAEAGGQPIQDTSGKTVTAQDLIPIFRRQAVQHFNFFDAEKQMDSGTPMAFSLSHMGDLQSSPSNIGSAAATYAEQTSSNAIAQAKADTAAAQGYKSTYNCGVGVKNKTKTQKVGTAACVINDPGTFVFNEMQTQIDKLGKAPANPPNHTTIAWELVADNFANFWMNRLFSHAGGNPITDISYITSPLQGLVEQSLTKPTFLLTDAKGNQTAGTEKGAIVTIPAGEALVLSWDVSKVLNATSVHLKQDLCSSKCPPSDDLPVNGNYSFSYDGGLDRFILDTFTTDSSGGVHQKYEDMITVAPAADTSGIGK